MKSMGISFMIVHGCSASYSAVLHYRKQATALIQRGTLKRGNILVAGTTWARVGESVHGLDHEKTCFLHMLKQWRRSAAW